MMTSGQTLKQVTSTEGGFPLEERELILGQIISCIPKSAELFFPHTKLKPASPVNLPIHSDKLLESTPMHTALQFLVSLFAVSSLLAAPARDLRPSLRETYGRSTVLQVPYGAAAGQVGLATDMLDAPPRGPESFAVTGDGIAIVDSVNGRLSEFRADGAFVRASTIGPAIDVIPAPDGVLYAFDPANGEVIEAMRDRANGRELRAASVDTEGLSDFVEVDAERGLLSLPGAAERFSIQLVDAHRAVLSDHARRIEIAIVTVERFGSARVIGVDDSEAVYVAVEQLLPGDVVSKEVRKYVGQRLVARFEVELEYEAHPTREFVVTGDGSVYHLRPLRNLTVVDKWSKEN